MNIGFTTLSLTPRFSEVPKARVDTVNRFSGFPRPGKFRSTRETAEAVQISSAVRHTPLKRGVNESLTSATKAYSQQ